MTATNKKDAAPITPSQPTGISQAISYRLLTSGDKHVVRVIKVREWGFDLEEER